MKRIAGLLVGLFIFGMVGFVEAAIITTTAPGINNYEWLDFSETWNMSRNDVEANLLAGGKTYQGFRYATRTETAMLLDSFYSGDITDVDDGTRVVTANAATDFLSLFGSITTVGYSSYETVPSVENGSVVFTHSERATFIYGESFPLYEDMYGRDSASLYGDVRGYWYYGEPAAGYFHSDFGTDSESSAPHWVGDGGGAPSMASLLVRSSTPVPIPSAILLLGSGILGLVGVRRKKQK